MSKTSDRKWEVSDSLPNLETWIKVWNSSGAGCGLFCHPAWLTHWAKVFKPQLEVWHSPDIYIPLHLKKSWGLKRLLSVGDSPCLYDEMRWPIERGLDTFLDSLGKEKWDVLQLRFWGDAGQVDKLARLARNCGWIVSVEQEEGIPWVGLEESKINISHKLADDISLNIDRLTKEHGEVTLIKASRNDWKEFIDAYEDLWKSFGAKPIVSRSRLTADFLKTLDERYTTFYKLNVGDKTIAWHFGYAFGEEFIYEFPTYDRRYAKYSPGKILLWFLTKMAKEKGYKKFSLGRGIEPYKLRWTKEVKPLVSVSIYRNKALAVLDPIRMRKALVSVYKKVLSRKR